MNPLSIITNIVTSPELSKRLCALGVEQEDSIYYWVGEQLCQAVGGGLWDLSTDIYDPTIYTDEESYAALTVGELGEVLPSRTWSKRFSAMENGSGQGWRMYENGYYSGSIPEQGNEAEARGLLFEYLLENKIITL